MTIPVLIDSWDQPGATWDSGLQWDVNTGDPGGDVTPWLNLVPPENNQQPIFMSMLAFILQPFADMIEVVSSMPSLFDLDNAVGAQLDVIGLWVGVSRNVPEPITHAYFSWAEPGLGWGQGNWRSPFDPADAIVTLADSDYRFLLRAQIMINQWDGTIPGAQAILTDLFPGITILIQDGENNHMRFIMMSPPASAVQAAMFSQGYLDGLVPAGVQCDGWFIAPAKPVFGWGVQNSNISGWGSGNWL